MKRFEIEQVLPGVYHIRDCMGVCLTLIVGERDSLLWDTGYGLYNTVAFLAPYVRGRLRVVLSHAHHDHACGHQWFSDVQIHPDDLPLLQKYTGPEYRSKMLASARQRGLIGNNYDDIIYLNADPNTIHPLDTMEIELGGLSVRFSSVPGHTPGSLTAHIPQRELLLSADSWNPTTWLFFPESLPLPEYVRNIQPLYNIPASHVLCSHDFTLHPMDRLRRYIDGLNAHTFTQAEPISMPYNDVQLLSCHPEPDSTLVFNRDKMQ